mmetsp:Transcript_8003/g.29612  ORF Transcript_8003/g.29612 Transcript_8003/m.29612 type:complete len:211 (-) Transcript_8003:970-1602(-)
MTMTRMASEPRVEDRDSPQRLASLAVARAPWVAVRTLPAVRAELITRKVLSVNAQRTSVIALTCTKPRVRRRVTCTPRKPRWSRTRIGRSIRNCSTDATARKSRRASSSEALCVQRKRRVSYTGKSPSERGDRAISFLFRFCYKAQHLVYNSHNSQFHGCRLLRMDSKASPRGGTLSFSLEPFSSFVVSTTISSANSRFIASESSSTATM